MSLFQPLIALMMALATAHATKYENPERPQTLATKIIFWASITIAVCITLVFLWNLFQTPLVPNTPYRGRY